jgi:hypothetical protein
MRAEWPRLRRTLVAALVCLAPAMGSAHELGASRYDFVRHVRPLFERHCSSCHRAGGVAPMSLLRYEEALPWANAVKLMVLQRRMPPFLPEEGVGSWRGARGLSARELDVLVEWVSGGAPRGAGPEDGTEPATPPAPPADLVVSSVRESVLSPEEAERSECVVFPVRLPADRPLAAIELRPGNQSIVRGAVIYVGDTCREGDRPVATWLPGDGPFEMPEGTAEVLRRGTSLSARIHYRKPWRLDGKPAGDRSRIALRFAEGRAVPLAHVNLAAGSSMTFERAVRVLAVFPIGPLGAALSLEAENPARETVRVLAIERFDPDWRAKYVPAPAITLPAGTRLTAAQGDFWIDYMTEGAARFKASPRRRASPGGSP